MEQHPYPSRGVVAWTIGLFFLASLASVMDRKVISLLVDPIRRDLQISDVQIGLLQGAAFAICFAIAGLPLGVAADRLPRKLLILAGIAIGGMATLASGLMATFSALFLCRLFVGIADAALSPAVISTIGDLAPPAWRGRLIGIFLMGQAAANGISIMIVGFILSPASAGLRDLLPAMRGDGTWRIAFVFCGAFGLLVAVLLSSLREPPRQRASGSRPDGPSWAEVLGFFAANWRVLAPFYLGFSALTIASYGLTAWSPTMLIRQFGMTTGDVGLLLGPMVIAASVIGALGGGLLSDRIARSADAGRVRALPLVGAVLIPGALAPLAPYSLIATIMVALSTGGFALVGTLHLSTLQDLFPSRIQGIGTALTAFCATMIGFTLGPLIIAVISTHLSATGDRIGVAMTSVMVPVIVLAGTCYWRAGSNHRKAGAGLAAA